ncbi:TPA: hypothetical protein EYP12_00060 [Candidatus Bipolaricaulota bacterium]|nr:hypothetical protein [Candidatus Bipolaricaulota bacterium]
MEGLLRAVEQVRERIERYRAELQKSEALTRYALIDPILRALGWETEDPEQVRPEFPTETGKPDYALIWEGKPRIMIEAKRLGTDLREARLKGINYANTKGVPFFICTDGNLWEVYEVFKPAALEERRMVTIDLESEGPGEATRKLLALWRPATPELRPAPALLVHPGEPGPTIEGITLVELAARVKPHDKPPRVISFPDGHQEALKGWKGLLVAVAGWVEPKLHKSRLPIKLGKRFLLSSTPVHSDGQPFRAPVQVGKLWLETNFSARECARHARRLLEVAGIPPDQVMVEF